MKGKSQAQKCMKLPCTEGDHWSKSTQSALTGSTFLGSHNLPPENLETEPESRTFCMPSTLLDAGLWTLPQSVFSFRLQEQDTWVLPLPGAPASSVNSPVYKPESKSLSKLQMEQEKRQDFETQSIPCYIFPLVPCLSPFSIPCQKFKSEGRLSI